MTQITEARLRKYVAEAKRDLAGIKSHPEAHREQIECAEEVAEVYRLALIGLQSGRDSNRLSTLLTCLEEKPTNGWRQSVVVLTLGIPNDSTKSTASRIISAIDAISDQAKERGHE